jgi:nucleotide-binding universal stress UspA family protein
MNSVHASNEPRYTILVAMAFDETDAPALQEAARLSALRPHSELHVVHSVVEESSVSATEGLVEVDGLLQEAPKEMQRRIESLQAAVPRRIVGHVRIGTPARAIVQTAADIDADVIVVGTHQRRGLKKMVLGSVAAQVLQDAHCPLLVAIPKDHGGTVRSEQVEPPCPDCVAVRARSNHQELWCEHHSHSYLKPHVYEPSGTSRTSLMPTY